MTPPTPQRLARRLFALHPLAKRYQWLTIGLGVVSSMIVVAQAVLLAQTISAVFLDGRALADLWAQIAGLLLLALLRALVIWASELSGQRSASLVKRALRKQLAEHVMALGPAYAITERTGELVNTLGAGIEELDEYVSRYLPQVSLSALVPLVVLLFVFPLDRLSGLVLLLTAPIIPVFMFLIGSMATSLTDRQWVGLSRMSAHFLDMLQGLTTLKLFGRSQSQAELIGQISRRFGRTTMQVLRVAFLSSLVLELTASLSTAIVAVEVGLRLLAGSLQFEQALTVLILAPEFYLPLRLLGTRHHSSMSGVTAAKRIFAILEEPLPNANAATTTMLPQSRDISFEDVSIVYDGGTRPALQGLSFQIEQGQHVALVGASGAGKSSVAHLLLRFIEPSSGMIRVGGRLLQELDRAAWRAQIAWVPQRPYLFRGTVAENVRIARPNASQAELEQAARAAHAHTFICDLPQGYDTMIGERGAGLSGGQAQRLALARAFLKDAPILILDEATSQIDIEHETAIRSSLAALRHGRTVITITHRLSVAADADRILVLDQGRLIEAGEHERLFEAHGAYQALVLAAR